MLNDTDKLPPAGKPVLWQLPIELQPGTQVLAAMNLVLTTDGLIHFNSTQNLLPEGAIAMCADVVKTLAKHIQVRDQKAGEAGRILLANGQLPPFPGQAGTS